MLPNLVEKATLNGHRTRAGWICWYAEAGDNEEFLVSPLFAFPHQALKWLTVVELAWHDKVKKR